MYFFKLIFNCLSYKKLLISALVIFFFIFFSISLAVTNTVIKESSFASEESLNDGYNFFINHDYHQALESFKAALATDPSSEKAHYWLGKCYSQMGHLETAIYHWERVINLRQLKKGFDKIYPSKDLEARSMLSIKEAGEKSALARRHYRYGLRFLEGGKWDSALAEFKIASELDATQPDFTEKIGDIYMDKNLPDLSVQYYSESIARNGKGSLLHYKLGRAFEKTGNLHQAVVQYKKSLTNNPENSLFRKSLERVSTQKERPDFKGFARIIGRQNNEVIIDRGSRKNIPFGQEYKLRFDVIAAVKEVRNYDGAEVLGSAYQNVKGELLLTRIEKNISYCLIVKEIKGHITVGDWVVISK